MSNLSEFLYINEDFRLKFVNDIIENIENETIPKECKLENDNIIYFVKIYGKFRKEHKPFMMEAVKQHFINNLVLIKATYYICDNNKTTFNIIISVLPKNIDLTITNLSLD